MAIISLFLLALGVWLLYAGSHYSGRESPVYFFAEAPVFLGGGVLAIILGGILLFLAG